MASCLRWQIVPALLQYLDNNAPDANRPYLHRQLQQTDPAKRLLLHKFLPKAHQALDILQLHLRCQSACLWHKCLGHWLNKYSALLFFGRSF